MVKENIIVTSQLGIHLRPAGAMCDAAIKFDSNISLNMQRVRQPMQRV